MNLETIESRFGAFLDKVWKLRDIVPFLLVYIQLLLLFKDKLSQAELNVVLERQKQLLGEAFTNDDFDELRSLSRKGMDSDLKNNTHTTQRGMLNRLLFCALLDTEEDDFFYLTEPIFEFSREMKVSPAQLEKILKSAFSGLEI